METDQQQQQLLLQQQERMQELQQRLQDIQHKLQQRQDMQQLLKDQQDMQRKLQDMQRKLQDLQRQQKRNERVKRFTEITEQDRFFGPLITNADKEFEGMDPCPMCYSVVHFKTNKLPFLKCKTCNHRFHGDCLTEWFIRSGKYQCILCQQPWQGTRV